MKNIINREAIIYWKWFEIIEKKLKVIDKFKISEFLLPITREPIRRLINFLGVRLPVYFTAYKMAMYERKPTFNAAKASKDFGWNSNHSFKETMLKSGRII